MTAPAHPSLPPRRRWWLLVPVGLVVVLVAAFFYFLVRGTWAAGQERNPATSSEGVVCQLVQGESGKAVRCAVVIDHPPERVWDLLTDFESYAETFPTLSNAQAGRNTDGTGWFKGIAHGSFFVGEWPVELTFRPEVAGGNRTLSWDSPLGDLKVCRGGFVLTPLDGGRTLAVYTLEIQTGRYPAFITNNTLLNRNPAAMAALRDAAGRRAAKAP